MRLVPALTAVVLTLGLAAAAPAAQAAPVAPTVASGCHFSKVTLSQSTVTLGIEEGLGVDVTAEATGCEAYEDAYLSFGNLYTGGFFGPSEDDPTRWSGTVELETENLYNKDAGTWEGTAYLEGVETPLDLGVSLAVKRASAIDETSAPSKVKKNKRFFVDAVVTRANWDEGEYTLYQTKKLRLQSRPSGGKWKTIKTLDTGDGGREGGGVYYYTKIKKNTCFRWVFEGSSTTGAMTSGSDCVKIKK